jgi:hypothetical protein
VTAVQISTNTTYTAKSNAAGVYSIDFVMPGQFTVTIEAQGFATKVYSNVTVQAAQTLNLNVALSVGSTHQVVTVTASPGLLDTADAAESTVLDATTVADMPDMGRGVWNDTVLASGVMDPGGDQGFGVSPLGPMGGWQIVNGAQVGANAYFLNGAPVNTTIAANYAPSEDSVEELQINLSAGAQYGHAAGGNFNAVVKSGTNKFHGDVYDYYEESKFDANSWGNNLLGMGKPFDMNNTWGATLGGPIQKDKTFFFFSVEGYHGLGSATVNNVVPTAAERQGNFTGTGYTIYDPSTTTCVTMTSSGCSQYGRTAFANDTIPSNRINSIGQEIANLYPQPNEPGIGVNYTVPTTDNGMFQQYQVRIDHTFSTSTRLYAMVTDQPGNDHYNNNGFSGVIGAYDAAPNVDTNAILDLTRTLSSSTVLDLKAAFSRYTTNWMWGQAFEDDYRLPGLNMPFVPTTLKQDIAPNISIANYSGVFANGDQGTASNTWDLNANVDQVKGHHGLNYGFEYMAYQFGNDDICGNPNGSLSFSGVWTQQNPYAPAQGSGNAVADLLLGNPNGGTVNWCYNDYISQHDLVGHVQDDFKVTKTVTLNIGVRWEAYSSPVGRRNEINGPFCFNCTNPYTSQINYADFPTLQNPLEGGQTFAGVTAPRAPTQVQLNQWQPRLGIAWSITPKTVFRAGFGIYYNTYQNKGGYQNSGNGTNNDGFSETTNYITSLNGGLTPTNYFQTGNPFPSGAIPPLGAAGGYKTDAGNYIGYFGSTGAVPWTQHWSVGFQRSLPKEIVLDLEYVGSFTHGLYTYPEWGGALTTAQTIACYQNPAPCNNLVSNPFYGVLPVTSVLGSSSQLNAWQLTVRDPLFAGIEQDNDPQAYSRYNSLSVRLQRQVKSANFIFNYRYGNNMNADNYQNWTADPTLWYGPWYDDVRHYISANLNWPLPVGKGERFLANAHGLLGQVVNNWKWLSTVIYAGGFPFTPPSATLAGGPGCSNYSPVGAQSQGAWFNNNPNCYQILAQYQLQTAPLTISYVRQPSSFAWNAALQKQIELPREGMFIQFRAECAFCNNSPNWGAPNNNPSYVETFTPGLGYTGFGALPLNPYGNRSVMLSMKLLF